jgi:23S rRNA (guanosine2251-2'-O)-methyltransferase
MAGNSERRGARRDPTSKKGAQKGTGGHGRKRLAGKGPTPKAEDRVGHPASRRQGASPRSTSGAPSRGGTRGTTTSAGKGSGQRTTRRSATQAGARSASRGGRGGSRSTTEVVAGRNAVVEALRADVPASALLIGERIDHDDRVREALSLAAARHLPVLEAPRAELDRLTDGASHQGLALQVPPYDYAHPDDLLDRAAADTIPALVVALDGVTDPRNLGAVVRSAAAFGAHGVVVPSRRAAGMTVAAWKTSAGAAARIPVALAPNLSRALDAYRQAGLFVVGLDGAGEADVGDLALADAPLVLVVGSEGRGLSRVVRERCDAIARIPIAADTESLNASVAAGIALYAVAAQRHPPR